jgi:DNA-binding transcriptional ArsR family regulator
VQPGSRSGQSPGDQGSAGEVRGGGFRGPAPGGLAQDALNQDALSKDASAKDASAKDALSEALAALAHPVRRDLLRLVEAGPARVTELAARFDISLPAVSRHLRVLEAAGFLERRVAGRDHFIEAKPEGMDEVARFVARQSQAWALRLAALKRLMEEPDG